MGDNPNKYRANEGEDYKSAKLFKELRLYGPAQHALLLLHIFFLP